MHEKRCYVKLGRVASRDHPERSAPSNLSARPSDLLGNVPDLTGLTSQV